MEPFSAHNIELAGQERTIPGDDRLLVEFPLSRSMFRTVSALVGAPGDGATGARPRLVDIGCLEGGYTVAFARMGFDAVGIEARATNIAKCRYVAERLDLPNLEFHQADARDIEAYGPFEVAFCCGLLYHLDQPTAFLEALGRSTRRLLVLDTHYASEKLPTRPDLADHLTELTEHEGKLGRWYEEFPEGTPFEDMERHVWSSYGNHRSFWIEKKHLLQTILDVGFDNVYEQFDYLRGITEDPWMEEQGRGLFVAVKTV